MAKARKKAKVRKAKTARKPARGKAKSNPRAALKPRAAKKKVKRRAASASSKNPISRAFQTVVDTATESAALRKKMEGRNTFED